HPAVIQNARSMCPKLLRTVAIGPASVKGLAPHRMMRKLPAMVARVTLEIALRKEFDYAVPPELAAQVQVRSRVSVPFGPRQVMGCVTAMLEQSTHTNLRPVLSVIG